MASKNDVFLKVNRFVEATPKQMILLKDLADIATVDNLKSELKGVEIKRVDKESGQSMVITALEVIAAIKKQFPKLQINHLGETDVVVEIVEEKSNHSSKQSNNSSWLLAWLVGIILFFGSGMAIMNFHADVSMSKVHQQIYQLIMGRHKENPLLLQVPYSLGIACGMLIFFNGLFNFNLDDDPSPLEIEMYLYEDKVNRYSLHEKTKQAKQDN